MSIPINGQLKWNPIYKSVHPCAREEGCTVSVALEQEDMQLTLVSENSRMLDMRPVHIYQFSKHGDIRKETRASAVQLDLLVNWVISPPSHPTHLPASFTSDYFRGEQFVLSFMSDRRVQRVSRQAFYCCTHRSLAAGKQSLSTQSKTLLFSATVCPSILRSSTHYQSFPPTPRVHPFCRPAHKPVSLSPYTRSRDSLIPWPLRAPCQGDMAVLRPLPRLAGS